MKKATVYSLCSIVLATLVGLVIGGIFFGMIIHEESHAIACLIFRVPIVSWSFDHVVYQLSSNDYVNVLIRLAGGVGQALTSFIFFLLARNYVVRYRGESIVQREVLEVKGLTLSNFIFGFELSFFAIAFHGIVTAIVEGFFYTVYIKIHSDSIIWLGVLALGLLIVLSFLYGSQRLSKLNRFILA